MTDSDTSGYCVLCGDYGRGKYAYPIEDRAEAITDHVGCKAPQPPAATAPGRRLRAGR